MGDLLPSTGIIHEVFILWCLPHLRTCLQTFTYPLLEVILYPIGLARDLKQNEVQSSEEMHPQS